MRTINILWQNLHLKVANTRLYVTMVTVEPMGWAVPSFPELSQRPTVCAVAMVSGRKHSPWANGACRFYGSRRKDAASPQRARLLWRPWPDRHLQLSAEQRWSVAAPRHSLRSPKDNFRPGSWGSRRNPKEESSYSPLFFFFFKHSRSFPLFCPAGPETTGEETHLAWPFSAWGWIRRFPGTHPPQAFRIRLLLLFKKGLEPSVC